MAIAIEHEQREKKKIGSAFSLFHARSFRLAIYNASSYPSSKIEEKRRFLVQTTVKQSFGEILLLTSTTITTTV